MAKFDYYNENSRTFPTDVDPEAREDIPYFGSLPEMFDAFTETTGYRIHLLRHGNASPVTGENDARSNLLVRIPFENNRQETLGTLVVWKEEGTESKMDAQSVVALARGIAGVVNETCHWVYTLRESELRQAVRTLHPDLPRDTPDSPTVSELVRGIIRDGAKLVNCQAASLYLLDEQTTSLKLRACWGLPDDRLAEPTRPLKTARADLEALLGNAVVLNEEYNTDNWNVPENFPTSLCVPIASDDTLLGTFWLFRDSGRTFTDYQIAVVEMIAGRLTAELEKLAIGYDYSRFCKMRELEKQEQTSRAAVKVAL